MTNMEKVLQKYVDVYGFISTSEYIKHHRNISRSNQDYSFLDGYKTIITLSIPYPKDEVKWKGKGYGVLSRYSYHIDYHLVYKELLRNIERELCKLEITTFGSVDTTELDERFAASLSKIGYLGKNQFLINKEYGTYNYLATILIDREVPKTIDLELEDCGNCTKCIEACPSNALDNGFEESKCISYLSQSKKPFDETEISFFKTMIYGCDICQKVCPKNKSIMNHKYLEFEPSGIENIHIGTLLKMSNKEYKKIYGNNASSWKGATIIKRNALCLIANQKLVNLKPQIKESMLKFKDVLWYNKTAEKVLEILERE